ncbi:hypothetical protein C5167_040395 [Papaver somniferum]|uniref:Stress-related protein n=1 Tax=Papaver somniferum TaxID=3469 RepID=A0A4Y7IF15_PAPSO|nr:stress-related protein-like [Papaver somniferum]RZC47464.1 hypothetical protein C5167_040395 [Papaver somniferum]
MAVVDEKAQPETVDQQNPEVVDQQPEMTDRSAKENLKYLAFIHIATVQAVVLLSKIYKFAKENSGPLKPGVKSVEGTVQTVVAPVYHQFKDIPYNVLKFVDKMVDESMLPSVVKEVSREAQTIGSEVQHSGLVETARAFAMNAYAKVEPSAKEAYDKYNPIAEKYAVVTWRQLNKLPLFPTVAKIMLPAASMLADTYNGAVSNATERKLPASSFLPLIPKERIAKVFSTEAGSEMEPPLTN